MKFAIVFCVIALATLAYSQPVLDTVNHHPSQPVKKPVKPIAPKPNKEHAKPNASKPAKEPAKPPTSKPVKEPAVVMKPDVVAPQNTAEKTQKPESIINIIIESHRPKPDEDYFNGKIVPTPKYPTN